MPDARIPGALGAGLLSIVKDGTLARVASPLPGVLGWCDPVLEQARREARRLVERGAQIAGELAYEIAMRELRALHDDVAAKLAYIAHLPADVRDRVAYEAFASGFTHYLPKKLLHRYVYGGGAPLKLTEKEMIDCNPVIDLSRSKAFAALLGQAAQNAGTPVHFEINVPAFALTNGTLGQFTVKAEGDLVASSATAWQAEGSMTFHDYWNFDPKDFATGGRSHAGELKTRLANAALPGKGFSIVSESVPFTQDQSDAHVVWAGGEPVGVPDRIAEADIAITRPDQK